MTFCLFHLMIIEFMYLLRGNKINILFFFFTRAPASPYMLNRLGDVQWTHGPNTWYCERRITLFSVSGDMMAGGRPRRARRSQEAHVVPRDMHRWWLSMWFNVFPSLVAHLTCCLYFGRSLDSVMWLKSPRISTNESGFAFSTAVIWAASAPIAAVGLAWSAMYTIIITILW